MLFQANHIVLVDVANTKETQEQLIGRLYRFGQERPVTVHHIFVDGTTDARRSELLAGASEEFHSDIDRLAYLITGKRPH